MKFTRKQRKEVERIVNEVIAEGQSVITLRKRPELFWTQSAFSGWSYTVDKNAPGSWWEKIAWIYIVGKNALATVWWFDNEWHYSIPIRHKQGTEKYQTDAWDAVEVALADYHSIDRFE